MLLSYEYDLIAEALTFHYTEPLTEPDLELAKSILVSTLSPRMDGKPSGEITVRWSREGSDPALNQKVMDLIPALKAAAVLVVRNQRVQTMHELIDFLVRTYKVPHSVASRVVVDLCSQGALRLNPDRTLDIPEPTPL